MIIIITTTTIILTTMITMELVNCQSIMSTWYKKDHGTVCAQDPEFSFFSVHLLK